MVAVALAAPAMAQERVSDAEIDARFQVLSAQRNAALDGAAALQARVAVLEQELAKAKKDCKPEPAKEKPKK